MLEVLVVAFVAGWILFVLWVINATKPYRD